MKKSKKLLMNKILFSGLLILAQLIVVFIAFLTIHRSSRFLVYLFKLISVLAALYIINKDDASAYKITWLVLIAAVPFVGGVLYLFLGDKKPSQRLQLAFLKQIKNQRIIENNIIEKVEDPFVRGQMNYLNHNQGYFFQSIILKSEFRLANCILICRITLKSMVSVKIQPFTTIR